MISAPWRAVRRAGISLTSAVLHKAGYVALILLSTMRTVSPFWRNCRTSSVPIKPAPPIIAIILPDIVLLSEAGAELHKNEELDTLGARDQAIVHNFAIVRAEDDGDPDLYR